MNFLYELDSHLHYPNHPIQGVWGRQNPVNCRETQLYTQGESIREGVDHQAYLRSGQSHLKRGECDIQEV